MYYILVRKSGYMDSNNLFGNGSDTNMDTSTDSSDDSLVDMYTRIVFMVTDVLSLIILLLLYTFTDKVKGTMLGKLMKSYCILSFLALLGAFLHTLMEFIISVTDAVCNLIAYLTFYAFMGSVISKVLFVCYIGYIFYKSHRMVLRDTTDRQIIKLKVGYFLTIACTPLTMLLILIIHDHVLYEIKFVTEEDMCVYIGEERFTVNTLIIYTVCFHAIAILALIMVSFLLYKAYKTRKAVSQDVKNLFRIALAIVVAFVIVWIIYAFHPLYSSVAPQVLYFTLTVENVVIVSVFVYNNHILTKLKTYILSLKCCNDEIVASRFV